MPSICGSAHAVGNERPPLCLARWLARAIYFSDRARHAPPMTKIHHTPTTTGMPSMVPVPSHRLPQSRGFESIAMRSVLLESLKAASARRHSSRKLSNSRVEKSDLRGALMRNMVTWGTPGIRSSSLK